MACASAARIQSMAAWMSLSEMDWQEQMIMAGARMASGLIR